MFAAPLYEGSRRVIAPFSAWNVPADAFILISVAELIVEMLIDPLFDSINPLLVMRPEPLTRLTFWLLYDRLRGCYALWQRVSYAAACVQVERASRHNCAGVRDIVLRRQG